MHHTSFRLAAALVASAFILSGCSSLKVYKVDGKTYLADADGSIAYALPKKTLVISATYVLIGCKTEKDTKGNLVLRLEAEITGNVVGTNEADSAERYLVPYAEMRSWTKDLNITVETYPNQTLKSLNGTITDQTGPVLTATATTLIKLVPLALAAAASTSEEMCSDDAVKDLADIATLRQSLDDQTKKPSDADAARATKKIASILADKLTTKVALSWTPTFKEFKSTGSGTRVLSGTVPLKRWLKDTGVTYLQTKNDPKNDVYIQVDVPQRAQKQKTLSGEIAGIVVADPAVGTIRICRGACPVADPGGVSVDNVLQTATAAFPQLGRKIVLPLKNYFLQTTTLELAVSEDGAITKLGVKTTSSAATSIGALGGNFDAAKAAIDANEKAKAAGQTAAQTKARDDNRILADCLDAQDKIVAKGGIPVGKCQ